MDKQSSHLGRREFLAAAATSGVGLALEPAAGQEAAAQLPGHSGRLRVALVGTGVRGSRNWGKDLKSNYSDVLEYVGLCDINRKRMAVARDFMGVDCPMFADTEFDEMIRKTSPHCVIITTIDSYHAKYICRALELGVDVISEKPMATDEKMVQEVLDTQRRTGRKLIIAENYRYSPDAETIKKIIDSEEIGIITSVDYNVYLDTNHGASYFRRWHGFKQYNGSILNSEGCHFLDLVQWWLGAEPAEVQAFGALRFYGYNSEYRSERCMHCPHQGKCEFFWDITKEKFYMDFYVERRVGRRLYSRWLRLPAGHQRLGYHDLECALPHRRPDELFAQRLYALRGISNWLQWHQGPAGGARLPCAALGSGRDGGNPHHPAVQTIQDPGGGEEHRRRPLGLRREVAPVDFPRPGAGPAASENHVAGSRLRVPVAHCRPPEHRTAAPGFPRRDRQDLSNYHLNWTAAGSNLALCLAAKVNSVERGNEG